jgi:hypothetical protein
MPTPSEDWRDHSTLYKHNLGHRRLPGIQSVNKYATIRARPHAGIRFRGSNVPSTVNEALELQREESPGSSCNLEQVGTLSLIAQEFPRSLAQPRRQGSHIGITPAYDLYTAVRVTDSDVV